MINSNQETISCTTETSENAIKIGIAITTEEKREIYHFRFQAYVEEMSKHIEEADYVNKLLKDDLDEWGFLLYAKIGSELIASARINIGTLSDFPEKVVKFLSLDRFKMYFDETGDHRFSYCAKLFVIPSYRSSPVLYLLMAKCYELSLHNQVQFVYCACNFHLLRLYEQMGFHRYSKNFVYPGYGLLTSVVFVLDDIHHLRTVRSPLFRIARKRGIVNMHAVEWFHENFTRNALMINSQLITEEELWSLLCNALNCAPTEAIALLHELTENEAKSFLHSCASLVQCYAGDVITNQGDLSYSYNILISGKLKSLTFHYPIKEYTAPGQHFGANGLTEHNIHTEDIAAVTSTQLLVLSGAAFPRFFHSHPDIAHKIVRTLSSSLRIK
ncbi:MAG: cyclic nucleotide-binding protein [Pelosinus sp.]|jgi:predicted GNAT family N-acyltransferase|nr:cyclic nucleotide-binding protein [Pelosinus sp.]